MSDTAPATVRAGLNRPGSGPQPVELLRSEGYQASRLGEWPPAGVEAGEEIESVWAGLGGAHRELAQAWADALAAQEMIQRNPLLSAEGKRAELRKLLDKRLEQVEAVVGDRMKSLGLARGRLEQARARAVEASFGGEPSPRRIAYEQELRALLRSLTMDERRAFLREAIRRRAGLVASAVFAAPAVLSDIRPAEVFEHLRAEWESAVAEPQIQALAALAKGEEVVQRAHASLKRLVVESLLPPEPAPPPPRPAA